MHVSATLFNTLFCFGDNADSAITWMSCEATKGDFIPVQQRKSSVSGRIPVEDTATTSQFHEDNLSGDEENEEFTSLFVCPDGCGKKFLTHGKLDQHVMYGKHQFKLERLTFLDRAKISYAQHLELSPFQQSPHNQPWMKRKDLSHCQRDGLLRKARKNTEDLTKNKNNTWTKSLLRERKQE